MTRPLDVTPKPVPPVPASLTAADRAIGELRRGAPVVLCAPGETVLMLAAEAAGGESLAALAAHSEAGFQIALTGRRASALGLATAGDAAAVYAVSAAAGLDAATVAWLVDPLLAELSPPDPAALRLTPVSEASAAAASIVLAKLARLLPAAAVVPVPSPPPEGLLALELADIFAYQHHAARTLRQVSQARVPLQDAEQARIVAFRPSDGGLEHLAIVIGEPDGEQPVLTRLHSECFTGDLLGSLRCDCGDQLRGAIAEIAQAGSGVLLYLAQEGRGIGLVNKLRAYQLQDQGFDTLDANLQLGFDDDERIYQPAAQMLSLLGIARVRLLTNNPGKVAALAAHGVEVTERVPHVFPSNAHNVGYLRTKAARSGHLF